MCGVANGMAVMVVFMMIERVSPEEYICEGKGKGCGQWWHPNCLPEKAGGFVCGKKEDCGKSGIPMAS